MQGIKRAFFILPFLFFIAVVQSFSQQVRIKGRVIDIETRDPLAFVNIQFNEGPEGCISDIDGLFNVKSAVPVYKLKLSYIGYEPIEFITENTGKYIIIRLQKRAYELQETIIKPGINPAHRIISKAIANRNLNDHEQLPAFSYTSYEKTHFGPESDSIPPVDSLSTDSSYIKAKEFFDKQHLFIMESMVQRSFKFPSENYNKVIASRVSGFSDPLFVFLISQLQSTSFYKDVIKIVDKNYINPISNGSFSKYYFEIRDTIVEPYPYDTTYVIAYRPLMKTNFDGLKGSISISTNGFAIRNVIAMPARDEGLFSVKIQQLYTFIDSTHWFPHQLNTELILKKSFITIDSAKNTRLKVAGIAKSYISDINLHPEFKQGQFGDIEVDVQPDAYFQSDEKWKSFRTDALTSRDRMTYHMIDSLGKARNFDKFTRRLDALMNGKITFGYMDLYLDNLFKVNHYEGARTGLKMSTSNKVSNVFKVGGYGAYGFKDQKFKYGADGIIIFDRLKDFNLKASFSDDVDEAGADDPAGPGRNFLNPEMFREILVEKMDHTRRYKMMINSRILKYMTLGAGFSAFSRDPLYMYDYIITSSENIKVTSSDFSFTEVSLLIRYAFGEKFMTNNQSILSLGTTYPVVQLAASHGFNNILGGQYVYNRFELKVTKSFFTKFVGTTSFTFEAGLIDRDLPYVNLFNAKASYQPFALYTPGSFATMRMDEFTSDRYATLNISHNFGKLLFRSKYFTPEPELVTNLGIGSLRHPENHLDKQVKSFEKGYFESGIAMNKIVRLGVTDVGFAWFYRYGPYALPSPKENMAWKLDLQFAF